jgi:chromosome segregation ATPase
MSEPNKAPETQAQKLAGINKHPAMIRVEQLNAEIANYKRHFRQLVIQVWNVLNPNKIMNEHYKRPVEDDPAEELRVLVLEMERTFNADINKADQVITTRNNEILALNQKLDRKEQESATQRIRISNLEDQVKSLQQSCDEVDSHRRELRAQFHRFQSESSGTIKNLRATVRVLSKELALEMEARATAENGWREESRRDAGGSLDKTWKRAFSSMGMVGEMTKAAVALADMEPDQEKSAIENIKEAP